ncbi:MAG TPA: VOC family protein [Gemmatimonadaceae bacterium]|jgi:methylmalonyl-CoA/ethylmalonyl-CoA epimerase|nr:VOC family protein [Gemmatimonadaceae bacterium]
MAASTTQATTDAFGLRRIRQIAITVRDIERATRFYHDTLGMTLLFTAEPGLAFFDCDGVRLMLSRPEGIGDEQRASILYYAVDDIEQAHRTFTARGVQFVDTPHCVARLPDRDVWLAIARDSEENLFGLMSEVRTS